jgi:hypothetical protein
MRSAARPLHMGRVGCAKGENRMKALIAAAFMALISCSAASAASKCYDDKWVPATVSCDSTGSKSADFSSGCTSDEGHTEQVEVPCNQKWVNVSPTENSLSQAAFCQAHDMTAADIDGVVCAAGERRPQTGQNASSINYRYGTWDSDTYPGDQGGRRVEFKTITSTQPLTGTIGTWQGNPGCDSNGAHCGTTTQTTSTNYRFCWNPNSVHDYDKTDLVVAYVCQ